MNFGKTYQDATTPVDSEALESQEAQHKVEEIRMAQLATNRKIDHNRWLQDPHTNLILRELEVKKQEFITLALQLANNFHQHNNHQQIIQVLNQANSITNTLNTYARPNS